MSRVTETGGCRSRTGRMCRSRSPIPSLTEWMKAKSRLSKIPQRRNISGAFGAFPAGNKGRETAITITSRPFFQRVGRNTPMKKQLMYMVTIAALACTGFAQSESQSQKDKNQPSRPPTTDSQNQQGQSSSSQSSQSTTSGQSRTSTDTNGNSTQTGTKKTKKQRNKKGST